MKKYNKTLDQYMEVLFENLNVLDMYLDKMKKTPKTPEKKASRIATLFRLCRIITNAKVTLELAVNELVMEEVAKHDCISKDPDFPPQMSDN